MVSPGTSIVATLVVAPEPVTFVFTVTLLDAPTARLSAWTQVMVEVPVQLQPVPSADLYPRPVGRSSVTVIGPGYAVVPVFLTVMSQVATDSVTSVSFLFSVT